MPLLNNGDAFPKLTLPAVGGGAIALPDAFAGSWGVVIIYRGAWCPFCNAQLAGYAAEKAGARRSRDQGRRAFGRRRGDQRRARSPRIISSFAVGYSADADAVAAATGAFVNPKPRFLQPASFVLAPDGTVKAAVYATSAIGRMTAKDVVGFVGYLQVRGRQGRRGRVTGAGPAPAGFGADRPVTAPTARCGCGHRPTAGAADGRTLEG